MTVINHGRTSNEELEKWIKKTAKDEVSATAIVEFSQLSGIESSYLAARVIRERERNSLLKIIYEDLLVMHPKRAGNIQSIVAAIDKLTQL